MYRRLLFYIWSGEGAWTIELDNVWCMVEYGNDWKPFISSQVECQSLCLKTPYCVGISYSYRAGMTHSCFFCKNDALETNSYGFGFYRMPGKIVLLSNTKYTLKLYPNVYKYCIFVCYHILIIDCSTDDDCSGNSDTCVSNYCHCGSSMKCLARADTPWKTPTCESGLCRCVDHDECPEDRSCNGGECQGMLKIIFKEFWTMN